MSIKMVNFAPQTRMKHFSHILILLVLGLTSCQPNHRIDSPLLAEATDSLWTNPQASQRIASTISRAHLSAYEQHCLDLLEAHLQLKLTQSIPESTDLEQLAEWMLSHEAPSQAAEAYYVAGAYANWIGSNARAMRLLKQAETCHPEGIIAGMTYYKMGRISETELLYEVATDYYAKSLPYLQQAAMPLYLASAYREQGRMRTDDGRDSCFAQALHYARLTSDSLLCLDIRYAAACTQPHSHEAIHISRFLCDSAGVYRYAYDLVKHYIRSNRSDSARHYLDLLARDTASLQWSANQYTLWDSQYKHLIQHDHEAYEQLLQLYNREYNQMEAANRTQTYAIAQRYDNETERAKNLQLLVQKQRLWFTIVVIASCALFIGIVSLVIWNKRRQLHLLEKAESEQRIAQLRTELTLRRDTLRQNLNQRIALSKNLQEAILIKHEQEQLPSWALDFIKQNIFTTAEQWHTFVEEFNGCYSDMLVLLQAEYPQLTSTDLQVIALTVTGLDIPDICLLLDASPRTIWSRRLRIKRRIGLGEETKLDEWLQQHIPSA